MYQRAYEPSGVPAYSQPRAPAAALQYQRAAYAPAMEPVSPARGAIAMEFQRQEVEYRGPHGAGTIVVDTPNRHLYLVQGNGRALRYGIGVGRDGFRRLMALRKKAISCHSQTIRTDRKSRTDLYRNVVQLASATHTFWPPSKTQNRLSC